MSATCISVDLDDLSCYHAIHGLDEPSFARASLALDRWLPRALELFDEIGALATFFVIGRDLTRDLESGGTGAALLREAVRCGHELGNHSYDHAYDLVSWPSDRIEADLLACDKLLRELGATPRGFRAPGYTHDERLLMRVAAMGYTYDSSALPSPAYFIAKIGAMTAMRALGRKSASHRGGGRSFLGKTTPYYRPRCGLWEVPISVSELGRIPLIGTSLLAGPLPLRSRLMRDASERSFLNLELHLLDFADVEADRLEGLVRYEPVLRVPWSARRLRLKELLGARAPGRPIASIFR